MDIPGFKLGREFANGKYCKGYNALNLSNHKTVYIQVFDSSLVANQTFSSQFRYVTSKLVDASFGIMTPILQADISNQACYVVSKYFPSPQQLSATPPTLTRYQALQFALQLAQTLDQLHNTGIVHGGIEYSSLYFKAPDQLMLKPVILQRVLPILRPVTLRSLERVQKRYLAPEANEGLTPATDFYALGILLYQLIFGSVPIDKTDSKLLEEWRFAGENRDLKDFFRELLAPDPDRRIQSLDQFTEALQQCGIDLAELAPSVSKTTNPHHHKTKDGEKASRSYSKWIVLTAGLAVVALTGTLILLPAPDDAQQRPVLRDASEVVASADTTNIEKKPIKLSPTATISKIERVESSPSVESLYQQALSQMETNPEAALQKLDVALRQKPGDIASLKLKDQIEEELEVRSLLNTAEQQLKELKLLQPSGDNAYESYQTLAEKVSSDDQRVRSGFTHIAATYHSLAENLFKEELFDKALEQVDLGLSVKHDYSPLLKLRVAINEHKHELQRKLKLAQLEKNSKREQHDLLKKQQQLLQEQRLLKQKQSALELKHRQEEQANKLAQQAEQQDKKSAQQAVKQDKKAAQQTEKHDIKAAQQAVQQDKKAAQQTEKQAINAAQQNEQQAIKAAQQNEQQAIKAAQQNEQQAIKAAQLAEKQAEKAVQQAEELEMESFKQAKVDALLTSANDQLKNGRLTLKKVFAAHLNYDELQKLNSTSQKVTELKKALINAYMLLADRHTSDKLYKSAIQAIEQGIQMRPEDRKQLQIKSQLSFSSF
ncbi:MAG: hypothetical protein PVI97_13030 [Candidatus Thiodiazotropha sp.]|jgi:serine/threonine protein kinase